ncbi:MAG: hypothetical protein ACRD10_10190 [Terriglobia bacterium]
MLTFHKIVAGCEEGRSENWRAFVENYTPVALQLERIYIPNLADLVRFWQDSVVELCGKGSTVLRNFSRQSEREFLLDLRSFLFDRAASASGAAENSADFSGITTEGMDELVRGLPLLHQEVLFLKLAGYSDSTLEKIFRITPAVAAKSLERMQGKYASALGRTSDECLRPGAWLKLHGELRAALKESCTAVRQMVRIQDGQVGWYDKEPVEKHLVECLSCLENWTALREVSYWRGAAPAVPPDVISGLLSALPIARQPATPKSFIQRIWGKP